MESAYLNRSYYFKLISFKHISIADGRPIAVDSLKLRKSFHRVNDEDELNAACINWAHFPCVVHINNPMRFRQNGTGLPRRVTLNDLLFLSPINTSAKMSNAIEAAYAVSEDAMNIFISYLRWDYEENGSCGNLFLFEANNMNADMVGPINDKLFGWRLSFQDEGIAKELKYNPDNFVTSGTPPPNPVPEDPNDYDFDRTGIITFTAAEATKQIIWTEQYEAAFGSVPDIHIWVNGPPKQLVGAPVMMSTNLALQTVFTVSLPGEDGFITLK